MNSNEIARIKIAINIKILKEVFHDLSIVYTRSFSRFMA